MFKSHPTRFGNRQVFYCLYIGDYIAITDNEGKTMYRSSYSSAINAL